MLQKADYAKRIASIMGLSLPVLCFILPLNRLRVHPPSSLLCCFLNNSVCENTCLRTYLTSAKKSKLPSHQVLGMFALEVNGILQATPPKLRREMGLLLLFSH